jgi:hypothetical protein
MMRDDSVGKIMIRRVKEFQLVDGGMKEKR